MEKGLTVKDVLKLFKKFREKHINFLLSGRLLTIR